MGKQFVLRLPRTNKTMMKLALVGLFCLEAALAVTPSKAHIEEWEAWKEEHGKTYPANSDTKAGLGELGEDESFRMNIWSENKAAIEKHNRQFNEGVHTFQLAMNEFGDLRGHEFVSKLNGFRARSEKKCNGSLFRLPANFVSLPASVDWRQKGAVTPVKNQLDCGSCWTFSATGALEAAHQIKTGKLVSLSEQQLVDCASSDGCMGGDMEEAFAYIKKNGGLDTEESYPYEGVDGKCRYKPANIGATDVGYKKIQKGDEKALMSAVANQGPCSVGIDASHNSFQFYDKGIYSEPSCSTWDLDHGVLVVGYGTCSETKKEFWLLKNSWGANWGEEGYFRMERNKNMCGVATEASYPLV